MDPNCCRVLGKSTSKKKLQTAIGGVSDHPKNPPVSAHAKGCNYAALSSSLVSYMYAVGSLDSRDISGSL